MTTCIYICENSKWCRPLLLSKSFYGLSFVLICLVINLLLHQDIKIKDDISDDVKTIKL